jgi:WD40 repeat protein
LLTRTIEKAAYLWDIDTRKRLKLSNVAEDSAFDPSGNQIVTSSNERAQVWDASSGKLLFETAESDYRCQFSPDGTLLVVYGDAGHTIYDIRRSEKLYSLEGVESVEFSPDGSRVLTVGHDGRVAVRIVETKETLAVLRPNSAVAFAHFVADGSKVVTGSEDKRVMIWGTAAGEQPVAFMNFLLYQI